jgi:hypothetical protein
MQVVALPPWRSLKILSLAFRCRISADMVLEVSSPKWPCTQSPGCGGWRNKGNLGERVLPNSDCSYMADRTATHWKIGAHIEHTHARQHIPNSVGAQGKNLVFHKTSLKLELKPQNACMRCKAWHGDAGDRGGACTKKCCRWWLYKASKQ